jgi:multidrug efflux pump subunit AcrA (membrane-fusion protein)
MRLNALVAGLGLAARLHMRTRRLLRAFFRIPTRRHPCAGRAALWRPIRIALIAITLPAALTACRAEPEAAASPEGRPVRTIVAEKREAGAPIVLTGRIEAEDEVTLAFRISGRLLESSLRLGDRLEAGQVVARLEPQNELNALRTAQANLAAAQGQLTQARNHFERQDTLLRDGWTTRANHDQATQALQTARSQVEAVQRSGYWECAV